MKKALTLLAAVMLLSSMTFAQSNVRRMTAKDMANISYVEMFKAMNHKAVTPMVATTPSAPKNVTSFPWTEDFEGGTAPTGFTFVDGDNDGYGWDVYDFGTTGNGHNGSTYVITSASYVNNVGPLTPDNWMILPAFDIPAGSDFELSWYEKGQDADYADEFYSVYINTTGNTVANFTATTAVLTSTTTGDWMKKSVSLANYAGQTIYIAFRHHNVTDMFYLDIDDMRIGGASAPDVTIAGPAVALLNEPTTFTASSSVSTFDWYVDGTQESTTAATLTYTFTTTGSHEVVVGATNSVGTSYDTLAVEVIDCSNIDLPYAPAFTAGLGCWDTICDSTHGSGWFTTAEMSLTEGQVLSMSAESVWGIYMMDFPTDNWLISPAITMPNSGDYEIAWQVKPFDPTYAGDHYGVYIIQGTTQTLLFEETLNANMTDFVDRMVTIPSTVSGNFQVAFRHFNSVGGYVIILDNIQVRELSAPVLALDGPTAVENGVAATFTAICFNADNFIWNIDGSDLTDTTATISYTFTSDGIHTVSVTAENIVGDTTVSMDVEVYSCEGIDEFPYTMGFEEGMRCWTMVSNDPANDNRFGIDTTAYTGNHGFRFSSYSSASDYNQYLITPEITLPTGQEKMFTFMYKGHNASESFRVLASTTDNNITSFTTVLGEVLQTATTWTEVGFALPAGTKYVAINYFANYQYYLYIDDITIDDLTAPTVTVSGPARVMAGNSATFTANAPLATSFSWTVDGTPVSSTTNTMTHTFTTTGNHTVSVTAINAAGSSNPANMTVEVFECEHISTFPYMQDFETADVFDCWQFIDADGDGYNWNTDYLRGQTSDAGTYFGHNNSTGMVGSASYAQTALTPDNWMILPAIDVPAGSNLYLNWFAKGQDAEYAEEHYSVYISTTGSSISDFTNAVVSETTTGEWRGHSESLANYAGQTIYVAFRHHDVTDMFYLDIDDISISDTRVSIDDVNTVNVSLYPNPVSEVLNINGEGINEIQVLDVNGRTVMTSGATSQLNLSGMAAGLYMVRVITNEGVHTQKIVKK